VVVVLQRRGLVVGFSRLMTTLTRYVAIFALFFLLSYTVNETSLLG
jgi:hypothetical protein